MDTVDWTGDGIRQMFGKLHAHSIGLARDRHGRVVKLTLAVVPGAPVAKNVGGEVSEDKNEDSSGSDNGTEGGNAADNEGKDGQDEDDGDSSAGTGTIVGGAVGGVAGVALVGGLVWFLLRRRRNAKDPAELSGSQIPAYKPEPGYSDSSMSPVTGSQASGSPVFVQGQSPSSGYPSAWPNSAGLSAYPVSAGGYGQPPPGFPAPVYYYEMPIHRQEPVEMPTGGERVELPQEGHTRAEMTG